MSIKLNEHEGVIEVPCVFGGPETNEIKSYVKVKMQGTQLVIDLGRWTNYYPLVRIDAQDVSATILQLSAVPVRT